MIVPPRTTHATVEPRKITRIAATRLPMLPSWAEGDRAGRAAEGRAA